MTLAARIQGTLIQGKFIFSLRNTYHECPPPSIVFA